MMHGFYGENLLDYERKTVYSHFCVESFMKGGAFDAHILPRIFYQ